MGRFPLAYAYEPPGQSESSMSDQSERFAVPDVPAPERGRFEFVVVPGDERLTRLPDGDYAYCESAQLRLGGLLEEEPPGHRAACDFTEPFVDRYVTRAIERAKLRRCKPMIARLKKELGEKIARSQQQQADEFRRLLHDAHHADAGDGDDWAGISYAGPRAARDLAVDIEIWNALQ